MASTLRTVARADNLSTVDAFRATQQLVDSAVPAVADIAVVEVAQSALCEHSTLSQARGEASFRRAAFRAAHHAEHCYPIGEASPAPWHALPAQHQGTCTRASSPQFPTGRRGSSATGLTSVTERGGPACGAMRGQRDRTPSA